MLREAVDVPSLELFKVRFMLSFSSTRIHKSFLAGLFSRSYSASLYAYLGLRVPNCNILHLALLNLWFFMGQSFKLVKVSLDGILSYSVSTSLLSSQLGVICSTEILNSDFIFCQAHPLQGYKLYLGMITAVQGASNFNLFHELVCIGECQVQKCFSSVRLA